jgi:transketolase
MSKLQPVLSERSIDAVAMRDAYCDTLIALAVDDENIVTVESDAMSSMGTGRFAKMFPERSINCGIMEAHAVSMATGLSLRGFIPFFSTFGIFATRRVFDQAFLSGGYARANLKIIGGDAGVTAAANGGTHMPLEDVAIMRAIPDAIIVEPADTVTMRALIQQMAAAHNICYLRCCRKQVVRIYDDTAQFKIGKANVIREGRDASIIAYGIMVNEALKAADLLSESGIDVRVVDHFTIKPLDEECVLECAEQTGAIVTAENHNTIGGLGSAVAEFLSENHPVPIERIGVKESFGEVGTVDYLMSKFCLTANDIATAVKKAISRKS